MVCPHLHSRYCWSVGLWYVKGPWQHLKTFFQPPCTPPHHPQSHKKLVTAHQSCRKGPLLLNPAVLKYELVFWHTLWPQLLIKTVVQRMKMKEDRNNTNTRTALHLNTMTDEPCDNNQWLLPYNVSSGCKECCNCGGLPVGTNANERFQF